VLHIAWPISCGVSNRELADRTGETVVWVAKQLDLLRAELERNEGPGGEVNARNRYPEPGPG
jgi:hypothetical protein